jgi:bifunctional DNA-binding transcriptional regulator/antitoxin component of YhaV-PrlF toxin-antitoxin module
MPTLVKILRKRQMTLPSRLARLAGLSEGDVVEADFKRGKIVLTPKLVIDRSKFPNSGDQYTPAQRRAIDRGIAQSEKEFRQGRGFGPFDTHSDFIASLHTESHKLGAKKNKRTRQ